MVVSSGSVDKIESEPMVLGILYSRLCRQSGSPV